MAAKYSGKNGNFAAQVQAFAEQAKEAIDTTLREIVIEIGSSVIRMSPVGNPDVWLSLNPVTDLSTGKTSLQRKAPAGYVGGRFRGNWMFSIGVADTSTTEQVDPSGEASMARIVNGALEFKAGDTAYITNSLPYAIPLEYGHSSQAPEGMVRITLDHFQEIVERAIQANKV